jgi:hypothetical protein
VFSSGEHNSSEEKINQLSEQVKLQVGAYEAMAEVYEKYSLALARIMELLRQLHDGVRNNDANIEQHFAEIVTCVTVVGESIKHAEEAIRLDHSVFSQRFNEFVVVLDKILNKVESTDNDIAALRKSAQEFYESINQTSYSTLTMVKDLHTQSQKSLDFWKRWRIWLYAFIGVIGILEFLMQFGILKLTWFK